MSNLKKTSYVFIALAIALLLAAISISVAFNVNKAYADYQDVIENPDSVVNFNQLLNIPASSYTSGSINVNGYFLNFSNSITTGYKPSNLTYQFISDHIYYLYINGTATNCAIYGDDTNTNTDALNGVKYSSSILSNISSNVKFGVYVGENSGGKNLTYGLIDLTQMFGSGNEPNLQQCRDLFVADYYSYDTGSSMSIGSIESYNKGVEDTLNSFNLTLSQYLVGSSAFAFNNSTITGSTISYDNTVNAYVFKNVIGVPLMDTIESGTNFTVDFTLWDLASGESQSYYMSQYLNFGYVDSNNNLINISKLPSTAYVGEAEIQYTGVFVLPVSTDTIYIWVSYNNDLFSDDSFIALDSNITFRSLNVASLIKASYAAGLQYNKDFYSVGGAGYNQIYQSGYHAGMLAETPYTFSHLLTAVIEAPLGAVLEIFNFDFMGYNFKNFITVMFTLCLIIAIVRMFMGGKE